MSVVSARRSARWVLVFLQLPEGLSSVRLPAAQSGIPREEIFVTTKVYRGFKPKAELSANIQSSVDALGLGDLRACNRLPAMADPAHALQTTSISSSCTRRCPDRRSGSRPGGP